MARVHAKAVISKPEDQTSLMMVAAAGHQETLAEIKTDEVLACLAWHFAAKEEQVETDECQESGDAQGGPGRSRYLPRLRNRRSHDLCCEKRTWLIPAGLGADPHCKNEKDQMLLPIPALAGHVDCVHL
jgi:hypothetical protein